LPTAAMIEAKLLEIASSFREQVFDSLAHDLLSRDRRGGVGQANKIARQKMEEGWRSAAGILAMAPGKSVLSELSKWSHRQFGVSFGALRLARELHRDEIAPEAAAVVRAIETCQAFPTKWQSTATTPRILEKAPT
jgi:hypothetical protein